MKLKNRAILQDILDAVAPDTTGTGLPVEPTTTTTVASACGEQVTPKLACFCSRWSLFFSSMQPR